MATGVGQERIPVLDELRKHCMSKDGVVEEHPWGEVAWKVKGKMFALSSEGSTRVTLKATPEEQANLITHPCIEKAAYVGRFGWVVVDIQDKDTLGLALDLIDSSYAAVRGKK
jgi:predicted DNA-binding protein (MmcQ/YjbR family)